MTTALFCSGARRGALYVNMDVLWEMRKDQLRKAE